VITAYFSLFRKGVLDVRLGRILLAQYSGGGFIRLMPELSFVNTGATVALVYDISAVLRRVADDQRERMTWVESLTTDFVPETRSTDTRFLRFPETIVVPKGDVLKERLSLRSEHSYPLRPGDYQLEITIKSDGTARGSTRLQAQIRVQSEDINFLQEHQPRKGELIAWNLRFQFERGPNTNCYVGKPPYENLPRLSSPPGK
jgi:hypothetical protein